MSSNDQNGYPTWEDRDLPVLKAAVEAYDADPYKSVRVGQLVATTGLTEQVVRQALDALEGDHLIDFEVEGGQPEIVNRVHGEARRRIGQWPAQADLLKVLTELVEKETEPEKKTRLRTALNVAKEAAGPTAEVLAAILKAVLGG